MGAEIRDSMGRRYELVGGKEGYRPPKQGEFYLGPTPTGLFVASRALFDFGDTYPILRRLSIRDQLPAEIRCSHRRFVGNALVVGGGVAPGDVCRVGILDTHPRAPLDLDAAKRLRAILSELIAEAEASE